MSNSMRFVTDLSKGVLGQPDSEELWAEIIAHIPDEVLLKPGVRILSVACGHSTEALLIAKRMLALGISKEAVRDAIWLIDKYQQFTNDAVVRYGFKNVVQQDFLTWEPGMKFDVVVGNPPFQGSKGNGTRAEQLYKRFVEKTISMGPGIVAMVLPSLWTHKPNQLKAQLVDFGLVTCCDCQKHFTTVDIGICYVIAARGYSGNILIGDQQGAMREIPRNKLTAIDLAASAADAAIMEKVCSEYTVADLWRRSAVNRNDSRIGTGTTLIVDITGPEGEAPVILNCLADEHEFPAYSSWKVVVNNVLGAPKLGVTKVVPPGVGTTYSVIALECPSESSADALNKYLNTKIVKFIVMKVKNNGANSKVLFSRIPKVDITRTWTDAELYAHFGLTEEEIAYIEATVK